MRATRLHVAGKQMKRAILFEPQRLHAHQPIGLTFDMHRHIKQNFNGSHVPNVIVFRFAGSATGSAASFVSRFELPRSFRHLRDVIGQ